MSVPQTAAPSIGNDPISNEQYIVLLVALLFSGAMSLTGSLAIIIASRKNIGSIYQRAIFSLSVADALSTLTLMMHHFLMPKGTVPVAMGNASTCTAIGFFFTVGKSTVSVYSAFISFYFFWKVRYKTTGREFARRFEMPTHVVATLVPVVIASIGVATDAYAPRIFIKLCSMGDCEMGQVETCQEESIASQVLAWSAGAYVIVPALCAMVFTIGVYVSVRTQRATRQRFDFRSSIGMQRSVHDKQLQAVRTQAVLYSLSYFNSILWILFMGIKMDDPEIEYREGKPSLFALLVFAWICYPLQGFLNFLVYCRPRYLHWRETRPDMSRWFAFQKAMSLEAVGPKSASRSNLLRNAQQKSSTNKTLGSTDEEPTNAAPVMNPSVSMFLGECDISDIGLHEEGPDVEEADGNFNGTTVNDVGPLAEDLDEKKI